MKKFIIVFLSLAVIVAAAAVIHAVIPDNSNKNDNVNFEKAYESVLRDSGADSESVYDIEYELHKKDGIYVYEIEITVNGREYEYIVEAESGIIIKRNFVQSQTTEQNLQSTAQATTETLQANETDETHTQQTSEATTLANKAIISVDKAKDIALKKAGLSAEDVKFTKTELEKSDGIRVYEIEFIHGNYEYEVEIRALDGQIIEFSREFDD